MSVLQLAAARRFVLLAATGIGGRAMLGMLLGLSSTAIPSPISLRFRWGFLTEANSDSTEGVRANFSGPDGRPELQGVRRDAMRC